jgi:choline dehydrogenase-like flavoprotein
MNGNVEKVETVIIGGGHAGLTMSYFLSQLGREHVILERGRVGERWRSERWDSFHFQFPNWTIELSGYKYQSDNPEAFAPGRRSFSLFKTTRFLLRRRRAVVSKSFPWSKHRTPGATCLRQITARLRPPMSPLLQVRINGLRYRP